MIGTFLFFVKGILEKLTDVNCKNYQKRKIVTNKEKQTQRSKNKKPLVQIGPRVGEKFSQLHLSNVCRLQTFWSLLDFKFNLIAFVK